MAQWCVNLNGRPDDEAMPAVMAWWASNRLWRGDVLSDNGCKVANDEAVGKVFDLVIRDSTTIPQLTS